MKNTKKIILAFLVTSLVGAGFANAAQALEKATLADRDQNALKPEAKIDGTMDILVPASWPCSTGDGGGGG